MRAFRRALGIPVALIPSLALPLALVAATDGRDPGEDAYRRLPALPAQAEAGAASLNALALDLANHLHAVPLDATGQQACAAEDLRVSWEAPSDEAAHGAHLDPLGPAPTASTRQVNGVVVCETSEFGFMGFEAWRDGGQWRIAAVPFVDEEPPTPGAVAQPPHAEPPHAEPPVPVTPAVPTAPLVPAPPTTPSLGALPSGPIEGYARYEPQRICDPAAKPGTLALRNLLLNRNPGTRSLGISRSCGAGGTSEHKEGRALDWGVLVTRAHEAAAADRFVGQLMAADAQGHRHALARRMGVMYVIWNRRIWSAYRPDQGWRPYSGRSPHTDHVHVSLSWAGAMGRTSFWSGKVDPSALLASAPVGAGMPSGGSAAPAAPRSRLRRAMPAGMPTEALRTEIGGRALRGAIDPATGTLDPNRLSAESRARWDQLSPDQQAEVRRRIEERSRRRARHHERRDGERRGRGHGHQGADRGTGLSAAPAEDVRDEAHEGERRRGRDHRHGQRHGQEQRELRAAERAARERARAERQAQEAAAREAERQRRESERHARHGEAEAGVESRRHDRGRRDSQHERDREQRRQGGGGAEDAAQGRERAAQRYAEQAERQARRDAQRQAERQQRDEARAQRRAAQQQRQAQVREQRRAERRQEASARHGGRGGGGHERRGGRGHGGGHGGGRGHRD